MSVNILVDGEGIDTVLFAKAEFWELVCFDVKATEELDMVTEELKEASWWDVTLSVELTVLINVGNEDELLATTELVCDEGLLEADTEDKADTYNEEEEPEVEEEPEDAAEYDELIDVGDEYGVLMRVVVVVLYISWFCVIIYLLISV